MIPALSACETRAKHRIESSPIPNCFPAIEAATRSFCAGRQDVFTRMFPHTFAAPACPLRAGLPSPEDQTPPPRNMPLSQRTS